VGKLFGENSKNLWHNIDLSRDGIGRLAQG
jgi:hypothetical protein